MENVKSNFGFNILLNVSNVVFPLISFPYITRTLGPEGFGKVQYVVTFLQYFTMIAALGIPIYGVREIAKARRDIKALQKVASELVYINVLTAVFTTVLYFTIVSSVDKLSLNFDFYAVASLSLILSFCNIDWLFGGLEKFKFIAIRSLFVKAISLICLFFFVKNEGDNMAYLIITIMATMLNNLWNIYSVRHILKFSFMKFTNLLFHFKSLLYIFSTIAAISIYALLDTLMLGYIKDDQAVGFYIAAGRISKVAIPILTALGTVLIPQISQAYHNNDLDKIRKLANYSYDYVILVGVPIMLGMIILSEQLTLVFSGISFLPSVFSMQVLSPTVFIIGLSNVWAIQILTPMGKDRFVTKSVIIGLIFSLVANLLLIPRFSFVGASVVNLFTELIVMACFAFYASKFCKLEYKLLRVIIVVIFTLISFLLIKKIVLAIFTSLFLSLSVIILLCSLFYFLFQIYIMKNEQLRGLLVMFKSK